ncbi:hypothetical protein GDO86_013118 [Hymenochirus boettgeri]|uniref:Uncharacterized protein n=1 Tax=Hymenochirus boettgeri TaxID=247094 RepID=A0A8T2IX65_9PIPI|nr:hypothetical protein GDO86_013118 [Hymenochirus boettgeri]
MSGLQGLGNQAQQKSQEAVTQGKQVVQDCVDKGKEFGQQVVDQGCQAAQKTCDQVSGHVKDVKLPGGWKK